MPKQTPIKTPPVKRGGGVCPYDPDMEREKAEQWFRDKYAEKMLEREPKKTRKNAAVKAVVATLDFETDPFEGPNHPIAPFCCAFYDGTICQVFWGADCADKVCEYIKSLDTPHIIYAHNGGKFDYRFMLEHIEPKIFTIGTRIVRASIVGPETGITHELRDSFSILPVPLADAAVKQTFDYMNMKKEKREKYKQEIIGYLKQDCIGLYDVVMLYRAEFGKALTMSSAAIKKLHLAMVPNRGGNSRKVHETLTAEQDKYLRSWYYGGRVECFRRGIMNGNYKIYDLNSSYPDVMRRCLHPISAGYKKGLTEITKDTDFAHINAYSDGALPRRNEDTGALEFPRGRYDFFATGHEIRAALELGLLKIYKVYDAMEAFRRTDFAPFIDHYYRVRLEAKAAGNETFSLFWKLVMNGAYGKFAQNPRKFKDTMILRPGDAAPDPADRWVWNEMHKNMDIYTRYTYDENNPNDTSRMWRSFLNVGTGASITGAARASLLRGIVATKGLVYCDTDSLISTEFIGELNSDTLGAWKTEAEGHEIAIVEKKTYAIWGARSDNPVEDAKRIKLYGDPYCVKLASKGIRATAAQIRAAAGGETITYTQQAPNIRLDGAQTWLTRSVKMNSREMHRYVPGSSRVSADH